MQRVALRADFAHSRRLLLLDGLLLRNWIGNKDRGILLQWGLSLLCFQFVDPFLERIIFVLQLRGRPHGLWIVFSAEQLVDKRLLLLQFLLVLGSEAQKALNAVMSVGGRPNDRRLTPNTAQLDLIALVRPVTYDSLSVAHRATQGQRAFHLLSLALREVLVVVIVLECCPAASAVEGEVFERVDDEPVGLFVGRVGLSAVRTFAAFDGPFGDAALAVQLVTQPALHHILRNYVQAD